jgi:hypothetical protein
MNQMFPFSLSFPIKTLRTFVFTPLSVNKFPRYNVCMAIFTDQRNLATPSNQTQNVQ